MILLLHLYAVCQNYPIIFKFCMVITVKIRYNLGSVATLQSMSETPRVHLKHAQQNFFFCNNDSQDNMIIYLLLCYFACIVHFAQGRSSFLFGRIIPINSKCLKGNNLMLEVDIPFTTPHHLECPDFANVTGILRIRQSTIN